MTSHLSYGIPDGGQLLIPAFRDDRLELMGNIDQIRKQTLPLPWRGMHFGNGAAGKPPSALEDGVFLSLQASDTTKTPSGYGTDPYGTAPSPAHSANNYDFAPNAATVQVFMAFSANTVFIQDSTNNYWTTDADGALTATRNTNYTPGNFGAEAVTGLYGAFKCWYPKRLVSEASLAAYTAGGSVAILKGRPVVAVGGNYAVGKIEIVDTLKVLIYFDLDNPRVI